MPRGLARTGRLGSLRRQAPRHPGPSCRLGRPGDRCRQWLSDLAQLDVETHSGAGEGRPGATKRTRARAHLDPGCSTTCRSDALDRELPRLLERSTRLARRPCHWPRQGAEVLVTDEYSVLV